MMITPRPLAILSVKLIAPYTNAPLCWQNRTERSAQKVTRIQPRRERRRRDGFRTVWKDVFFSPGSFSHRLVPDETCRHGERHDQDGGGARPQQHPCPVHLLTHLHVHQDPVGEAQHQQQAQEVRHLRSDDHRGHLGIRAQLSGRSLSDCYLCLSFSMTLSACAHRIAELSVGKSRK